MRGAVFTDFGALWGYNGPTVFPQFASSPDRQQGAPAGCGAGCSFQGDAITVGGDSTDIRASVGVSLIWSSPMGPIRFDFAKAVLKNQSIRRRSSTSPAAPRSDRRRDVGVEIV
ncbi:MAG: BamA/TamA family outer membrane protein [Methylovirgula sp.]